MENPEVWNSMNEGPWWKRLRIYLFGLNGKEVAENYNIIYRRYRKHFDAINEPEK